MVRSVITSALGLSLAACAATPPAEQTIAVTGQIAYRERIALPDNARIEVRLDDVSLADAPARTLARQEFTAEGKQVPFAFSLHIDRSQVDPMRSYAVAARISDAAGGLMFVTDTRNSVALDDRPMVDLGMLMLVKAR